MAEPPRREQIALALAEKVGVRHRDEKKKAIDAARRHLASYVIFIYGPVL